MTLIVWKNPVVERDDVFAKKTQTDGDLLLDCGLGDIHWVNDGFVGFVIEKNGNSFQFFLELSIFTGEVKVRNKGKVANYHIFLHHDVLIEIRIGIGLKGADTGKKATDMLHNIRDDEYSINTNDLTFIVSNVDNGQTVVDFLEVGLEG